ncbi:MAG: hypothetical protein KBG78_05740 [Dermatophilaceae bacterium]|nr:hypothetical protein [Comamonadaceae bacterium]MBK6556142.1 hypothetical protein [Comamonadaceae bacterium]MBK6556187.1 hypothetical protein [Comamonadaceae bacterium]MBK7510637.1 hypothetical protein [Comamonadaceae bacterium]MBP8838308.1 hypothetical protein [Dermatophilaceae bacterium]
MTVTPDQVALTLGDSCPTPVPYEQWDMWISDATLLITDWATRNGYTFAGLDSATVDYVIRESVALKVKRPDSATQVDVAVDDGRVSRRYESSTGQITILPEWWDLLTPAASTSSGGAFSVSPYFEPDTVSSW